MNLSKKEWQKFHDVLDEKMAIIETVINTFHGKLVRIWDTRKEGRWGDGKKPVLKTPAHGIRRVL